MNSGKKIKGYTLLTASVLVLIFGIGFFIFFLVGKIKDLTADMQRISMPGTALVNLEEAGAYSIFYEYKSIYKGKNYYSSGNISRLELNIKEKDTGRKIQLKLPTARKRYDSKDRAGYGIYDFEIQQPGEYIFTGKFQSGEGNKVILAVTHGFTAKIMKFVITGIFMLFGTIILSILLLVFGILNIRKERKADDGKMYKIE